MQMTDADNEIKSLGDKVKNIEDAEDSALALVEGLRVLLKKAVEQIKGTGVQDYQIQSLTQLDDALAYGSLRLATSVVANTHRW